MVTKVTRDVFDGVTRPIQNIVIDGGTINGTSIGLTTPSAGRFTSATSDSNFRGNWGIGGGALRDRGGDHSISFDWNGTTFTAWADNTLIFDSVAASALNITQGSVL